MLRSIIKLIIYTVFSYVPAWGAPWQTIHSNEGIHVYERVSTLGDLPDFKATSSVQASLFDLIAVLQDINRRDEWVHRCSVSYIIKKYGEFEILLYHKTDSPWPVSDRDAVIKTGLYELEEERRYLAYFRGVQNSSVPHKHGSIRLPHVEGYYLLEYIHDQKTRVTYFVHLDPGGSLPQWLVKRATRDLPTKTIIGLRKQIKKTQRSGVYGAFHRRWNPMIRPVDAPVPPRPPSPSNKLLIRLGLK